MNSWTENVSGDSNIAQAESECCCCCCLSWYTNKYYKNGE